MITDPDAVTPWELRNGRWYKREDLHRNAYGVNGSKYRAARHLMTRARAEGYDHVVSAQSVLSPQSSIVATLAEELGMSATLCYGASKATTAVRHPNVAIAAQAGAVFDFGCRVAYNGTLQPYGARLAAELGAWQMPYAITPPAAGEPLRAFLRVGGAQVVNLPPELRTLIIAFGSGNTTAGVLWGLRAYGHGNLERVVLVGVGPDRMEWLRARLAAVGVGLDESPFDLYHQPLHPWYATYSDRMPETSDGIVMHPTYEGKVVRYLAEHPDAWPDWTWRHGTAGLWIVGGPT